MQCVLLFLPAMLVTTGAVPVHSAASLDWLLLGLLASSAGVQVVMVSPGWILLHVEEASKAFRERKAAGEDADPIPDT